MVVVGHLVKFSCGEIKTFRAIAYTYLDGIIFLEWGHMLLGVASFVLHSFRAIAYTYLDMWIFESIESN